MASIIARINELELTQRAIMRQIDCSVGGGQNIGINWDALLAQQRELERDADAAKEEK